MPVEVAIVTLYREAAGCPASLQCNGRTVRAIIAEITQEYPRFQATICNADNGLKPHVLVLVRSSATGELVDFLGDEDLSKEIAEGSTLWFDSNYAGG